MAEETTKTSSSLSGDALEVEDVLAGAEEWSSGETWLVLGSFGAALVALIIGLMIVPTSIIH